MRTIREHRHAEGQHWVGNGFHVQQLFSHMGESRVTDPFLLLDYAAPRYFAPNEGTPSGVGEHPHKGFETVTVAYQGEVAHRDSSGGGGVIRQGDVQWMTAGSGLMHEEFHSPEFSRQGGMFEMVQLWVNLPARFKNEAPRYRHLAAGNIPVVDLPENAGSVRVIAGNYNGTTGPADTYTPINMWDITLNPGTDTRLEVPASHQLLLVILRGNPIINGERKTAPGDFISFNNEDGGIVLRAGGEEVKALLLSGEPINEPVVGYGPFVMNTHDEIQETLNDFRQGRFGSIPD